MSLVIHPPIDDRRLVAVREAAGAYPVINAQSPEEALTAMPSAEAFFGKMTPELLAASTRLRWVQSPTASLEHYMFPALAAHECVLTNMRGLYSDVIAEHVFGMMISLARNLQIYARQQTQAKWEPVGGEQDRSGFAYGPGVVSNIDRKHLHLTGSTLGIVGLGAIGSEIGRLGEAFRMNVISVDPLNPNSWPLERLDDLLAQSDWVVIAAPHTPRTEKLFRRAKFERMKRSAYLINIGRGAIVDLADLTGSLQDGLIAGAALDVFETEPLPAGHPLWAMENVILTPHVAGYSTLVPERHLAVLTGNVREFVSGQPLNNIVRKDEWF